MFTEGKNCTTKILLSLMAAAFFCAVPASAQQFATIDPPGSTLTSPGGINNLGQIVGAYFDNGGVEHCFLLSGGVYSTIDYPGAAGTACAGINNMGEIVGSYVDSSQLLHGFSLNNGAFTTIDDPAFTQGNFLAQISDLGLIAGDGIDSQGAFHGFTLTNNVFKTINYPSSNFTQILDMSFNGVNLVGAYSLSSFPPQTTQGFTLINGVFTSVTYPGSASSSLSGVTNVGLMTGTYTLPNQSNSHGFLVNGSTFTSVDFPGATSTGAANMNDLGQVVGVYVDSSNVTHGFLMSNGPFAYVANINSNTVSMIDTSTALLVSTINVGAGPWGTALSPDGTQLYVTNNHGNNVTVVSTANNAILATIPVQSGPLGLAFTPDGTAAYVVNGGSNSVSVISTSTQTVTNTVTVGSSPVGVAMAPTSNGTFAYVTNAGSTTVSVIAVGPNPTVVQTITVGSSPHWAATAPNSSLVYVENAGSNNVSVISVATNTVTATIPVGSGPFGAAFSPDSSTVYVANEGANTVSVINTAAATVVKTIPGFNFPIHVALTTDGSAAYVTNLNANTVSVVSTASNTITTTVGVGAAPIGIAIAAAPPQTLQITLPLSPTQPNVFNYGTHNFTVQYPQGSNFNNINMTTVAVQMSQAEFQQRVAGTPFATATCIVYNGAGGNCIDYQVTCSQNGSAITCPSESTPTIDVETDFTTAQPIINPGYLTTPIGENNWTNIFSGFSDPLIRGKTQGFSEFVGVDLGVTTPQGLAKLQVFAPKVCSTVTCKGSLPVFIRLTSVVNGSPITGAQASISEVRVTDANGNPMQGTPITKNNAFVATSTPGDYGYKINISKFPPGTYNVTVYGDSFAAQQIQVKLVK